MFDAQGRPLTRTLPLGQSESMSYFTTGLHTGMLQRSVDFEGRVTDYVYDSLGRQQQTRHATSVANANAGTYARTITTTYDALGRVKALTDTGHGLSGGTTSHVYDAEGRLVLKATPEGTLHYEYDPGTGQLLRTYTNSTANPATATTSTSYRYDALGRMKTATATRRFGASIPSGGEVTTYAYDATGAMDYQLGANGLTHDYRYNALGRLIGLDHFTDTNGNRRHDTGETLAARFEYAYDAVGNRTQAIETLGSVTQTFNWSYDALNRLNYEAFAVTSGGANPSLNYWTEYYFDLASNRTNKNIYNANGDEYVTYTYDANDRLLSETSGGGGGTATYGYNNAGEQTSKTTNGLTTNYRWDAMGRMTGIDADNNGSYETTYQYDADGVRVSVTTGASTTTYLMDGQNPTGYAKPIEERINGTLDKSYTLGLQVQTQADAQDGVIHLLHDAHGSTRALTSGSGGIINNAGNLQVFSYDAFGNPVDFNAVNALTTWLFANDGQYDPASKLSYHLARWRQGQQMLGRDPAKGDHTRPWTYHPHAYALPNPVGYTDPTGRFSYIETQFVGAIQSILTQAIGSVGVNAQVATRGALTGASLNQLVLASVIGAVVPGAVGIAAGAMAAALGLSVRGG